MNIQLLAQHTQQNNKNGAEDCKYAVHIPNNKHSNDEMEKKKNKGACRSHKKYGTIID